MKPNTLKDIEAMATRGLAAVKEAEQHAGLPNRESWMTVQRAHADAATALRAIMDRCRRDR